MLCVGRFGLGWAHYAFIFACHMFIHFHAYVPSCFYHLILKLLGTFLIVSLSLSPLFSLLLTLVASWNLNVSLLRLETLFVLRHLLLLLHLPPLPLMSGSVMRKLNRTSWRTFHDVAFIRNAKPFCQNFLTLVNPQ